MWEVVKWQSYNSTVKISSTRGAGEENLYFLFKSIFQISIFSLPFKQQTAPCKTGGRQLVLKKRVFPSRASADALMNNALCFPDDRESYPKAALIPAE